MRRRRSSASADGGTAWRAITRGRGHRMARRRRTASQYNLTEIQTSHDDQDNAEVIGAAMLTSARAFRSNLPDGP